MAGNVTPALNLWHTAFGGAWVNDEHWLNTIDHCRALWATISGIDRPDAIIPTTSDGQGLRAVLNAISDHGAVPNVVTTRLEFDSIDFILKMYASKGRARLRYAEPAITSNGVPLNSPDAIIEAITPETDLVVVSQVTFGTGAVLQHLDAICERAQKCNALTLLDTYHSAGVMPIRLDEVGPSVQGINGSTRGPDFAIGGSYKYVRGGPGACWLAVNPRHLDHENEPDAITTLDTGWFAKQDTFAYRRPEAPLLSTGGDAWLESTPPVLTAAQAIAGLEFTLAVGVDRLRELNLHQQATLRAHLRDAGLDPIEPEDPAHFGAFTLLPHPDAATISNRLRDAGVNTDARGGFVRFGPDPLNTPDELEQAAAIPASTLS